MIFFLSAIEQLDPYYDSQTINDTNQSNNDLVEHHDIVAVGTSRGSVKIILLHSSSDDVDLRGGKVLYCAKNFTSSAIKFLQWNSNDMLWICDDNATIYMLNRIQSLSTFLMPNNPVLVIKLDSQITAISSYGNSLAVSTLNRSIIYNAVKSDIKQIGCKPRSSGNFGIAFYHRTNQLTGHTDCCVYTSRPRARLWQANLDGNVQLTHLFKSQILNSKASPIYSLDNNFDFKKNGNNLNGKKTKKKKSNPKLDFVPNFVHLNCMEIINRKQSRHILIAQSGSDNCLFLIDPITGNIITWTNDLMSSDEIVHVVGNEIIVVNFGDENNSSNCLKMSIISVLEPFDYLNELAEINAISAIDSFLLSEKDYFKRLISRDFQVRNLIEELRGKLENENCDSKSYLIELLETDTDSDIESPLTFHRTFRINLNGYSFQSTDYIQSCQDNSLTTTNTDELICDKNSLNNVTIENSLHIHERKINDFLDDLRFDLDHLLSSKCKCGHPKPGSHLNQKNYHQLEASLNYIISESNSIENYLNIAFEVGYWSMYCNLLLQLGKFDDYLQTCLSLNDLTLLENAKFIEHIRANENGWQLIISNFSTKLASSANCYCLNCGNQHTTPSLQWNNLFRFMSSNLTPSQTIKVLRENEEYLPEKAINPQFCLSLIKSHIIYNYQSKKKDKC